MRFLIIRIRLLGGICLILYSLTAAMPAQIPPDLLAENNFLSNKDAADSSAVKPIVISILPNYFNAQDGVSLNELMGRALRDNRELAAMRLEIEKAKARLAQARLRPNPTLEFEQESGRLVGDGGNGQFSVGASLPIEIYGRRGARINAAQLQIKASEAEVRNRERILTITILADYAETLSVLREIDALEKVLELELQTTRFVQIRVNEGDTAPLELSLLQAEIERLRARRQLAEGRLQSAIIKLKTAAGIPFEENLIFREEITSAVLPTLPQTLEAATDAALRNRPEIHISEIEEQVAAAGLRLVRASAKPDLTAYTRYRQGNSTIDLPTGEFPQNGNRSLTFGVAVGIPVFNKNQGAKAEAEIAVRQAQIRREYIEKVVRSEVLAAYRRYEAATLAVSILQNNAIPRSNNNVETFRKVYELGEIKITDLIAEQRRLLDATRDLTEALTQKYRAQADIHLALGASAILPEAQ